MRNGRGGISWMFGAVGLSVLPLVACSGGPTLTPPVTSSAEGGGLVTDAPTTTLTTLGSQYEQIVAPANTATAKINLDVESTGTLAVTTTQFSSDVGAAARAFTTMDQQLLSLPANQQTQTDIGSLVAANQKMVAGLTDLASDLQAGRSAAAVRSQLGGDIRARTAAVTIVRQDLGLPPTG